MNKRRKNPKNLSSTVPIRPAFKVIETDTHPNIFYISLSLSLLLSFLLAFSNVLSLTSAAKIFMILLGIANVLTGIAFLLKKDVPRNFGFITLVISSFLYGIFLELEYATSNFTLSLYALPALASLLSGIFFITQEQTRKDLRFLMLSGFLIAVSVFQIARDIPIIYNVFSIVFALFALAAAVLFFRGK